MVIIGLFETAYRIDVEQAADAYNGDEPRKEIARLCYVVWPEDRRRGGRVHAHGGGGRCVKPNLDLEGLFHVIDREGRLVRVEGASTSRDHARLVLLTHPLQKNPPRVSRSYQLSHSHQPSHSARSLSPLACVCASSLLIWNTHLARRRNRFRTEDLMSRRNWLWSETVRRTTFLSFAVTP